MNGGLNTFISTTLLINILRLASNMLLASWLAPEAFALAGIVGSIVFAFEMFSDAGFKSFVLRHKDGNDEKFLNAVWTSRFLRGVILGSLFLIFSGVIAQYFNIPDLKLALQVTSIGFFVRAAEPMGYLLAERQNNVAKVLKLEFIVFIAVTSITVIWVYVTRSLWPLIFASILNSLLHACLGYFTFGRFGSSWYFNKQYIIELFGWAKFIIPSSIITLIIFQVDKFILGKVLTVNELGLYYIAFNLSNAAMNFVINYPRRILEPYMASIYREIPKNFKDEFYLKKTKTSVIIAFIMGCGIGGADLFFGIFYDSRYILASDFLKILIISPALALITYSGEVSLILHGKLKMSLNMNFLRLFWLIVTTWFAYNYFGALGVIMTFATIEVLPMIYVWSKLHSLDLLNFKKELLILVAATIGGMLSLAISSIYTSMGSLIT